MNLLKRIPDRPAANWLIMLVMAMVILMLLSPDSYLHNIAPRIDSAWFFMCGKAWMNGMVPYVDFADSKGPLLWLIYGVGYLLSHYDYHGVFWVSVVVYSFTFYFLLKTARIFVEYRSQAILAVLMTAIAIFNPVTHNEMRAEDFGMFFTALSLWQLCRLLYAEHTERDERTAFFAFGISLAGTLLIKYNITAMCCIFPAIGLYHLLRERHPVWQPLLACAAGFAALALPFLVYFLIQGSFSAFIQEYFINTLQTIENKRESSGALNSMIEDFSMFFELKILFSTCMLMLLVIIITTFKMKPYKYLPLGLYLCFMMICINCHAYYYYYSLIMIVGIFPMTQVFLQFKWCSVRLCILATFIGIAFYVYRDLLRPISICDKETIVQSNEIERIISEIKNPRVISLSTERGWGVTQHALPATKYWALQAGYTELMFKDAIENIGKSDFVFVDYWDKDSIIINDRLKSEGFKFRRYITIRDTEPIKIYSR